MIQEDFFNLISEASYNRHVQLSKANIWVLENLPSCVNTCKCLNCETPFELLLQVCNEKLLLTTTHVRAHNLKTFIFVIEGTHYYQNLCETLRLPWSSLGSLSETKELWRWLRNALHYIQVNKCGVLEIFETAVKVARLDFLGLIPPKFEH